MSLDKEVNGKLPISQGIILHSMHTWEKLIELSELLEIGVKLEEDGKYVEKVREEQGMKTEGYDQDILYTCMKLSSIFK